MPPTPPSSIQELVGARYTPGGRSVEEGFDCLTVSREAMRRVLGVTFDLDEAWHPERIDMLEVLMALAAQFEDLPPDRPEPGCLVDMRIDGFDHCGVMVDRYWLIHCRKGPNVVLSPLHRMKRYVNGFHRLRRCSA